MLCTAKEVSNAKNTCVEIPVLILNNFNGFICSLLFRDREPQHKNGTKHLNSMNKQKEQRFKHYYTKKHDMK